METRHRARRRLQVAALVIAIAGAAPVRAHDRSVSYSAWNVTGDSVQVTFRVAELDLSRVPGFGARASEAGVSTPMGAYLASRVSVLSAGRDCGRRGSVASVPAAEGWRAYRWRFSCPGATDLVVRNDVLFDDAPAHIHIGRVHGVPGSAGERVLSYGERTWQLVAANQDAAGAGSSLRAYVDLGVRHILSGYDHLAFVFALILLAGSLGQVAALATAFTLAHSVTLALAVLGLVRPQAGAVEALIGFSIALVAAENAWLLAGKGRLLPAVVLAIVIALAAAAGVGIGRLSVITLAGVTLFTGCHFAMMTRADKPEVIRGLVAFCFGLVHGFGFAGVLAEAELPSGRLASALLGFNIGVELGQLAVIALAWPLMRIAARSARGFHRLTLETGSAAICGLGTFWFLVRALG